VYDPATEMFKRRIKANIQAVSLTTTTFSKNLNIITTTKQRRDELKRHKTL
jgi:hypothetical protein